MACVCWQVNCVICFKTHFKDVYDKTLHKLTFTLFNYDILMSLCIICNLSYQLRLLKFLCVECIAYH